MYNVYTLYKSFIYAHLEYENHKYYYQQRNDIQSPENASGFKLNLSVARKIKWEIHVFPQTIEGSLFTAVIPSHKGSV